MTSVMLFVLVIAWVAVKFEISSEILINTTSTTLKCQSIFNATLVVFIISLLATHAIPNTRSLVATQWLLGSGCYGSMKNQIRIIHSNHALTTVAKQHTTL